ncbi:formyltransferase family protein [Psychromonas ossibalaenae]|uniref:formyltransferase family protein n=1 Tax=Psychromonas ossibalaenae TaxID=444922 RepID=UPI000365C05B|nr:formyltransferase family protein [Psychromonas ossibalaenae]
MDKKQLKISILADNPNSWIMPYIHNLIGKLTDLHHHALLIQNQQQITPSDIVFILACEKIVPPTTLSLSQHNLVIHESALPYGKGWSPLTWQILDGKKRIPITLFEADEKVDAGDIYFQEMMNFEGHELVDELHQIQGQATIRLCLKFIDAYPDVKGIKQTGRESYFPQRTAKDSQVSVNNTIEELFNNFRVADNEKYPVFFELHGKRYNLKIEKVN